MFGIFKKLRVTGGAISTMTNIGLNKQQRQIVMDACNLIGAVDQICGGNYKMHNNLKSVLVATKGILFIYETTKNPHLGKHVTYLLSAIETQIELEENQEHVERLVENYLGELLDVTLTL